MQRDIKEHLTCPICYSLFTDPLVIKACQHTFCRKCITSALVVKATCPVCRKAVLGVNTELSPNRVIANIINDNRSFLSDDGSKDCTIQVVLKLSITERYAPNWKPRQGVREIIQNWYDGVNEQIREGDGITHLLEAKQDKLVITTTTKKVNASIKREEEGNYITTYTATFQNKVYGIVEYNNFTQILSITNYNVALSRRILLLGSSNKVGKDYLVGQFGEGLKIGILALVRENKLVVMNTNGETWSFGLHHDGQYGEYVLGVAVAREKDTRVSDDTCTTVHGLSPDDWKVFSQDFLFLTRPKEFCDTINGTLLLDDAHRHKLFVKGFWICDMKDSGLVFGVNLHHMELDRDRRAVVQKHDIENKVADIWSKAITVRKDLLPIFYDLLMMNDEMISKAQWYINDEGVHLVANFFISTQGQDAQPVLNTRKEDVLLVEHQLKKKAVLCPEPLYNILIKSVALRPLEEVLKQHINGTNEKIPLESLTSDETNTLTSVLSLLHTIIEPWHLSTKDIEIFSSKFVSCDDAKAFGQWKGNKAQLSRLLFDKRRVHEQFNRCTSVASGITIPVENCRCVETFMLMILISLRAEAKTSNFQMKQGFEKLMVDRLMEKLVRTALADK